MTFLETLQSHKGGLIRLKSELYWYDRGSWDENPGQICLLLDAAESAGPGNIAGVALHGLDEDRRLVRAAALLLIDGCTHWVRVVHEDVEIL